VFLAASGVMVVDAKLATTAGHYRSDRSITNKPATIKCHHARRPVDSSETFSGQRQRHRAGEHQEARHGEDEPPLKPVAMDPYVQDT
jgi:hypothetical protein